MAHRSPTASTRRCGVITVVLVLALLAASCGGDDDSVERDDDTTTTAAGDTTTSAASGGGLTFVGSDAEPADPTTVPDADVAAVAAGDVQLGLELLRRSGADGDNVFLSPYSIATALAMLLPGARGTTADEIADVLSVADETAYHPARGALDARVAEPIDVPVEGDVFTLRAANQLFGQDGFPFLDEYLDLLARYYAAQLAAVDFTADPEDARELVNQWVADQTEDKITDLIPAGVISALTRLVLVNAVYFNASWLEPFEPELTEPAPFRDLDGTVGDVDMMRTRITTAHADGDGYEAVRLGYAGGSTSMLVVVPDEGTFADFADGLDAAGLEEIRGALVRADVDLGLPRFEVRTQLGLRPLLEDLGMVEAFVPPPGADTADLTGITEEPVLFVQDALHEAVVTVDEAGTEAAAATAIIIGETSLPESVTLTVDRPFLFVIQHDETGEPLFLGQVTSLAGTGDGGTADGDDTATAADDDTSATDDAATLTDADVAAIEDAFASFFGGLDTTVDEKVALLEDGETYRGMLDAASADDRFQQMATEIRSVEPADTATCASFGVSAPCAVVTHDLLVSGFPMAAAVENPAVLVDGTWLVGAAAWCNVVEIGGASCP